jgi:hypothetical protein
MKHFKIFSLSPAMCLFLVACGGGSSTSNEPSPVTVDTSPPVITVTGDTTVNHEQGTTYSDQGATAQDAVDGSVTITVTGSVEAAAGTYTLTYSATDKAGNTATASRTIIVADTIAPTIALIGSETIAHEQGTSYVDAGATATDAVDDSVEVVITGTVNAATAGTYTLTYTATDQAGNISSTTRTLVVADTTGPLITVPTDISVESSDNGTTILATDSVIAAFLSAVTANDTVDGSVTVTSDAPDVFSVGATTVTFFAIDAAGNSTTSYAIVSVSASTAVVRVGFRLPAAITVIETVE